MFKKVVIGEGLFLKVGEEEFKGGRSHLEGVGEFDSIRPLLGDETGILFTNFLEAFLESCHFIIDR